MMTIPPDDRPAGAASRSAHPIARAFAGLAVGLGLLAVAAALAFVGGFVWFAHSVPTEEQPLRENADGIVVLTGGASRIADAVDLLAAGHGKRLLISGVHRGTSPREISRAVPRHENLLACCVDLDYAAVNTLGNAEGTRRWVKQMGFRSLIVVTSNYHMPRTMAELGRQLPDVRLIPFVVVSDKMRTGPWWSSAGASRLLLSEYLKYVVAQVRMRIEGPPETQDMARARAGMRS